MKLEITVYDIIGNTIQNIKGKEMIILHLDNDVCHIKAIMDGEVMDKDRSCHCKYELLRTNINIYRLNTEVDDDESYYKISNITTGDNSNI